MLEDAALAESPPLELARARIEQAKNEAISPEEMLASAQPGRETSIAQIYRLYQERMRAMNAMDFSDLQLQTWILFQRYPEILEKWQRRAAHLLVDEYQDTNRVQYLIVKALAARSGNLCVVGDEDQSIYRWRGADIRNILDFERDYPTAQIFKLEQNYRSTKTILAAAGGVIRNNTERKIKNLWTENGAGEPVTYYTGVTERDEADFIALEIARLTGPADSGPPTSSFSIASMPSRARLKKRSCAAGSPTTSSAACAFTNSATSRICSHTCACSRIRPTRSALSGWSARRRAGSARSPSRRSVNWPRARISRRSRRWAGSKRTRMSRSESPSRPGCSIRGCTISRARIPELSVRGIVEEVVAHSGFVAYLGTLEDATFRKQNLAEMLSAASAFDAEKSGGGLPEFLERVALVSDSEQIDSSGGRAALMTLHTSKGLEYPMVFIAGMEEGLFPHSRSADIGEEIEEERRLCYVGMTRARQLLYLTNTLSREIYGVRQESRPSRFLREVDPSLIRRIAPERHTTPDTPAVAARGYVDYSDSQLPDDEPGPGGDGFVVGARGDASDLRARHHSPARGARRRRQGVDEFRTRWSQVAGAQVREPEVDCRLIAPVQFHAKRRRLL